MDPLKWGIVVLLCHLSLTYGQLRKDARWCTINPMEMAKCEALQDAIEKRAKEDSNYPEGFKPYDELPKLECLAAGDQFDCMHMISENDADLMQLDPGMGYTAGEYYTMTPLMAERYATGAGEEGLSYKAVAVVRKDNGNIQGLEDLQGAKSCHTGVGRAAGWVYPVSTLIEREIMPITECNVPVKSAASFFGDMCAPGGLARYYNPFGNNPVTVCENCKGDYSTKCTTNDPYAGYHGSFDCVASGDGDVAFVRDTTVEQGTKNSTYTPEEFELLCLDGSRVPADKASACHWGEISSHIVMTSAIREMELRSDYKMLLDLLSRDFGSEGKHKDIFELFTSIGYGRANLLFTDATKELKDVGARDSYYTWVGEEYRRRLVVLNTCPIAQARWCVISRHEMSKCENMIMAFSAKNLKPDLNCILGDSVRDCMNKIRMGDADMVTLDAADVYIAGKAYELVPIAAEDYTGYDVATYYAVAVARKIESHLTIFNLKSRRSCHSAVMTAAGWIIPVDKLIETGQIVMKSCNAYFYVGQFFSKSCVPGILHEHYNRYGTNPINLCEACASGGTDRCIRNDEELYYGNSGAFRCLAELGGDVAFMKHTTVRENTDGRNEAEWSRNRRSDDYELLCNDGTRKDIDSWSDCNMGEIPSNAIVTAAFKTEREREIYWTLLNFAQQFFASDSNEDFPMFDSMINHKDLLFQDSTVRLIPIEKDNQNYEAYLGKTFMRAMERMHNIDCVTSGQSPVCRRGQLMWAVLSLISCLWTIMPRLL